MNEQKERGTSSEVQVPAPISQLFQRCCSWFDVTPIKNPTLAEGSSLKRCDWDSLNKGRIVVKKKNQNFVKAFKQKDGQLYSAIVEI
ncbi:MAG: hypothetical protein PHU61_02495 [Candidatus Absconditabacteria bacterium]|nr:hypothetical protein [Candidatus Absconditabacteria bacterium]MDD3868157.1 hypothetical protein [Candidatus Absconditabacteria bacterium]MDD4714543.1 hypothetical protein [Candidatus Absconditabacteria bacterium]